MVFQSPPSRSTDSRRQWRLWAIATVSRPQDSSKQVLKNAQKTAQELFVEIQIRQRKELVHRKERHPRSGVVDKVVQRLCLQRTVHSRERQPSRWPRRLTSSQMQSKEKVVDAPCVTQWRSRLNPKVAIQSKLAEVDRDRSFRVVALDEEKGDHHRGVEECPSVQRLDW